MGSGSHQQSHCVSWRLHNSHGLFKLFSEPELLPARATIRKHLCHSSSFHAAARRRGF